MIKKLYANYSVYKCARCGCDLTNARVERKNGKSYCLKCAKLV